MRWSGDQNGFGMIQALMIMTFVSVVLSGAITWNEVLNKSRLDISSRAHLLNLKRSISMAIKSDSSWIVTVSNNVNQSYGGTWCLTGSRGFSCGQVYRGLDVYDAGGGIVYQSLSSGLNGITSQGNLCGPHAASAAFRNYTYPSRDCPYRLNIRWVAMTNEQTPFIAVIADLYIGISGPNFFSFNPSNYDISLGSDPLIQSGTNMWNGNLLYRRALP